MPRRKQAIISARKSAKSFLPKSAYKSIVQRSNTVSSVPNKKVTALVNKVMDQAHQRLDIGPAGVEFMECVLNPFGVDHDGGPKVVTARIPDSKTGSVPFTLTAMTTFSGGTSANGVIELRIPNITDGTIAKIHTGADPMVKSNTPTGSTLMTANESVIMDAIIDQSWNDPQIRYISGAIRVYALSATDDTAGSLEGFMTTAKVQTAVATWQQFGYILEEPIGTTFKVSDGIQVRTGYNLEDPQVSPQTSYADTLYFAKRPVVRFSGLEAGTTLRIEVVVHLEALMCADTLPFFIGRSVVEPELEQIVDICNKADKVVAGNSFKSFIANLWKISKKAIRFVADNPEKISKAAGGLLKLVGA